MSDNKELVAIVGASSSVSLCLRDIFIDRGYAVKCFSRSASESTKVNPAEYKEEDIKKIVEAEAEFYIFNLGLLLPKNLRAQDKSEIEASLYVNMIFPIRCIEEILCSNKSAQILIVGSESGKKGSYDTTYFLAKASLRAYVRERKINYPGQRLILLSPSTIGDAGMTTRREDQERLAGYKLNHPKCRFLTSLEVASIICSILLDTSDYLTNVEVELNGGKFARMAINV